MSRRLHTLHLVLGPIIWAAWFVVLYAGLSVACSLAPPDPGRGPLTWLNGVLLALTLVVAASLAAAGWRRWRESFADDSGRFVGQVSAGVYLLSALSTLMIGLPVVFLPPCP